MKFIHIIKTYKNERQHVSEHDINNFLDAISEFLINHLLNNLWNGKNVSQKKNCLKL